MKRSDGRKADELREVEIVRNYLPHAEGSSLIKLGETQIVCTATVEEGVPPFLRGKGQGWVTAEYAMIPRATEVRSSRESTLRKVKGRTHEIQRLIGRCLRTVTDLNSLGGEVTIWIDTDVIRADGGTRTAAISGSFVALSEALIYLQKEKRIKKIPLDDYVAAVSVGMVGGKPCLDLNFEEDVGAEVDMNVVMNGSGKIIEVQGTAEKEPFGRKDLDVLLDLASKGTAQLVKVQKSVMGEDLIIGG